MKAMLMGVAALTVLAVMTVGGTAQANGPKGHGPVHVVHPVHPVSHFNYHLTHGVRFTHGYYFRGPYYNHFNYRYWSPRYRCYFYYYPGLGYYYWSGQYGNFYPMSYLPVVGPSGVPPVGINTLPSQLPSGLMPPDQMLPPGVTPPYGPVQPYGPVSPYGQTPSYGQLPY